MPMAFVGKLPGRIMETRGRVPAKSSSPTSSPQEAQLQPGSWMGSVLPAVSKNISIGAAALRSGEVVLLPLDAGYAVAASAMCESGLERLQQVASPEASSCPVELCLSDISEIAKWAATEHIPPGFLEDLLPGPLTLVLPALDSVSPAVAQDGKVRVRIPNNHFVVALSRGLQGPLAVACARRADVDAVVAVAASGAGAEVATGQASPPSVESFRKLWGELACVFDGGQLPAGAPEVTVLELLPPGTKVRVLTAGSNHQQLIAHLKDAYNMNEAKRGDLMPSEEN